MKCPRCAAASSVLSTRGTDHLTTTRRRRLCENGHRFTTLEIQRPSTTAERHTLRALLRLIAASLNLEKTR